MPLLRFDIIEGRTEEEVIRLLDVAHVAVVEALGIPERDRYQVVNQHKKYEIVALDTGLGFERTDNFVLVSVTSNKRTLGLKQALYKNLTDKFEKELGISPEDVMINFVENSDEDWSFGKGVAQFITKDL
ncbi:tautomerase family protein [Aerococcus urinaeequi]|uniref:Tautomerase family protein n=1 Tax=Aerococcus urinaeequi TaxID=51665 RepID=A0AA47J3C5_9LACT|nr:tautomerase family protein [Aerococcus urinaeequi]WAT24402.1 tautomerase family protein [Aerococcus urinaeequi]